MLLITQIIIGKLPLTLDCLVYGIPVMDNGDAHIGENLKVTLGWDQVITERKITLTVCVCL